MTSPRRPWWQQATALVSLGAGGAITGFAFAHGTAEHVASPASVPVTLTALDQAAQGGTAATPSDDSVLRSAIVSVSNYYLRLAQSKTPAEMEALIWQRDSTDGADHGESCAAFASMTLELAAQMVGQQSWVTGGSTYPWPVHDWVDARVDPNPASPGITSVLQDAQAHQRWHPVGDGYDPLPGDWVLFNGHVEVVTQYTGGVLHTIGGDSLPNFSVNAHEYSGSLSAQGVVGFVGNGNLPSASGASAAVGAAGNTAGSGSGSAGSGSAGSGLAGSGSAVAGQQSSSSAATQQAQEQPAEALAAIPGASSAGSAAQAAVQSAGGAAIPGMPAGASAAAHSTPPVSSQAAPKAASAPPTQTAAPAAPGPVVSVGMESGASTEGDADPTAAGPAATQDAASIPGLPSASRPAGSSGSASSAYTRHRPPAATAPAPGTSAQQAFINQIAPGAMAAQRTYGVPAAVTIAQAIDESGWGQSTLATTDHNLFGIKGTGPAGSDTLPTQEDEGGQMVSTTAPFRVYHDVTESIEDHGKLLAQSGYYAAAMAERQTPNSFASALSGVYATDPNYGTSLIDLMRQYNLYRFDASAQGAPTAASTAQAASPAAQAPQASRPAHAATRQATPQPQASTPLVTRPQVTPKPQATATAPGLSTPSSGPSPSVVATAPVQAPAPASAGLPSGSAPRVGTAPRASAGTPSTARPAAAAPAPASASSPSAPSSASASSPAASASTGASASQPASVPSRPAASPAAPGSSGSSGSPTDGNANPAGATSRSAATATATGVPHPFATPTAPSTAQPAPQNQAPQSEAEIPGIPAPSAPTSASTSAQVRSPVPAQGVADLAAVFRPESAAPSGPAASGPAASGPAASGTAASGMAPSGTAAPGTAASGPAPSIETAVPPSPSATKRPAGKVSARQAVRQQAASPKKSHKRKPAGVKARSSAPRYQPAMPTAVKSAFLATARKPLTRAELMYRDVAGNAGISWKILAACDWMQCEAHPRYSPVQGEKLGAVNADGTVFYTKSEALTQCANDLVEVAGTVYDIDLTVPVALTVLELANVFAAFRWGSLLRVHNTSAMEFPYSVQGLTDQFANMRWPRIPDLNAPDKPGSKFRRAFGAVPVVLNLEYPAIVL